MKATVEEKLWCNSIFWIITVQCLRVVVSCQCFVCALRGGGACLLLLSPIILCLTCRDPDHEGKNWGLTISLHYAECDQGSGHCVTGTPETRPGVRQQPASWSCWQPRGHKVQSAEELSGEVSGTIFTLGSHGVTTLQHRNSVTEWQTEAPDGPPALLTW